MTEITVKLLDDSVNNAVIQLPGRQYPGILVQGDSLKSLADLSAELVEAAQAGKLAELRDLAHEIDGLLRARLLAYEDVLRRVGHRLPYPG